jgi:hypothetical protein
VAEAKAEAYRKVAAVIGPENAALLELMKLVDTGNINITPSVMVGGGSSGGATDALMGTILRDMMNKDSKKAE